ncbi:MAG TPA: N-acetyltransferase [Rhizomicrobium sp.]|jgi:ribosomal protein S18 acetylase RimI-like enzyme|nr:N-acetyltransferase [Rhizomicrobium sp.]
MILRCASETDISALQTLLRNSWLTTWAPQLPFAAVQRFAAEDPAGAYARDKWREFIVADAGGALLGMFHVEADHLHAIHLDPGHKRRRIGSVLMDEVERRIAEDHPTATLEARAFNTAAIAFYERRGWRQRRSYMATESGEPCETVEMVKDLR